MAEARRGGGSGGGGPAGGAGRPREGRGSAPEEVLLGLGANLGDPLPQLARALDRLGEVLRIEAVSSAYRSEPVGVSEPQPDYFNAVVRGSTLSSPGRLLRALLALEAELGRVRAARNASRTIDIDLLAFGDRVLATPELTLPHPRLHRRAFVLLPLAEVAPQWRHPELGRTAAELLEALGPHERVERWGALAG